MTYQACVFSIPEIPDLSSMVGGFDVSNITIDANDEAAAVIFESPVTDTITKVRFRTNTVTTGGDLDIRIETVSGGEPTGTLWATTTNIVRTMLAADDNAEFEVTLTSAASVTKGDKVAIVIKRQAGSTFAGVISTSIGTGITGFPTSLARTTSYNGNQYPSMIRPIFGTSGQVVIQGIYTYLTTSANISVSTSTTPDVVGNVFSLPFNFKVSHLWAFADFDGSVNLQIIDSDGVTVAATSTNPITQPNLTTASLNVLQLSSDVTLSANTSYRVVFTPTTATSSAFRYQPFTDDASRLAMPKGWSLMKYTSAKDPTGTGSWTDDGTKSAWIGIIVSAIDIPAGGGDPIGNGVVGLQSIGTGVITG